MPRSKITQAQVSAVAFKARRATNISTTANTSMDVVFDSEYYDYGSGYSTSTGLFTAPVSGVYHFTAAAYTETSATGRAFWASRGTAQSGAVERVVDYSSANAAMIARIQGSWEVYMSAGQTFGVSLWTSAANQLNSADTWFSGHMVASA